MTGSGSSVIANSHGAMRLVDKAVPEMSPSLVQASLDLANSDYNVYLVEQGPTIGGLMARLDKTFPTNDCTM